MNNSFDLNIDHALRLVGEYLTNQAKINLTNNNAVPNGDNGELRNSITYEVSHIGDDSVVVGTNLFYAPWVEFGTGAYAEHGDGRKGWWVYVDDGKSLMDYTPSKQPIKTEQEAIDCCNYLRNQLGLNAFYTNGQQGQPFLRPALNNHCEEVKAILKRGIIDGNTNH